MAAGRRHPGPVPNLGAMPHPVAMVKIKEHLQKLNHGFSGLPAPHAATHLQGGVDAFPAPGTPSTIDPNLAAGAGSATNYARADVRPAIDLKLTTKGDSLTRSAGAYVREGVGADGTLLRADSTQGTGRIWATIVEILLSLLTTKGDSITRTTTTVVREGVGADGTVLTADSTEATGRKWVPPAPSAMVGLFVNRPATPAVGTQYAATDTVQLFIYF